MTIEIFVPDIGDDEVDVTEILVKVGDKITADQSLMVVEGDKASMEVPASTSGTVAKILINVGDKVKTGSLIMMFDAQDSASSTPSAPTPKSVEASAPAAVELETIFVPDIGEDEVDVTEILVKVGDNISIDQSLMVVEGDKASMEVPSPKAGIVSEITIKVGDKVKTGSAVMVFSISGSSSATQTSSPAQLASPLATSHTKVITVPDIGSDEVDVTEILVKVGDTVKKDQSLIVVEGDKASMEVPAQEDGIVSEITINVGDKVKTGSNIMVFTVSGASSDGPEQKAPVKAQAVSPVTTAQPAPVSQSNTSKNEFEVNQAYVHATPLVRRLAREFGVNLAKVKGTGRKNRILREDVQAYVKEAVQRLESGASSNGGAGLGLIPWPKVDFAKFGAIEEVDLSRIQKLSGANLSRNWVMIPHVTQFDEVDISDLEAFRKQQNQEAEKRKLDVKYTPLVFLMKAVAKALEEFPRFNSSLSEDGQKLILKKYINIGVAVDTPNGLVVPVFKDVNNKGIIELSRELMVISKKAREGKLTASDMQGGCFTISSLGGLGGTSFTPIVNAPEVAILGVSKSAMKPVWNGKEFAPKLMLPLSLSYDHRVIDGADGARFITYLGAVISDLRRLVM
ncbi:pyruvate dehydrogenase complex dihydrolipoyllysine-residue acetyltransferase [Thorsellia kenyensis]|uniref:Acetyltransferase component of pyruvate dehydrogenase complex n=1 Tax=Thorsellia kenyensis TaxID=1549888 RepID=A0ABV6CDM6_9GAMM